MLLSKGTYRTVDIDSGTYLQFVSPMRKSNPQQGVARTMLV